ncbi:DNA binding HTH domain, Fis-type [uncultured Caudovirales phage]|uniref:DNA binding HTH domain, Fis-type n=1 Tax=uncultured Caudovirales phage TaxID=2100421 RepID=A0A6J5KJA9_9CAUD|nr:DNA binding HTH domain, Fis-type [uncultured Caudovirales phage]
MIVEFTASELMKGNVLDDLEKEVLRQAMVYCRYNKSKVALCLGVSRGTIYNRLTQHFGRDLSGVYK